LESPPYSSSAHAVNTTGLATLPTARRVPFTWRIRFASNFTTTPGAIVRVTPALTVTSPVTW
jgi:hypothetical protein